MSKEEIRIPGLYYTVIDGSLRTKVDETHPEAVRREYETKDGAKAIKFERIVSALSGYIEDIAIHDGDFGKTINIKLDKNESGKHPIIQINAATNYGSDFLKKVPNIDLSREVRIRPFAFTAEDTGKDIRGLEITQGEGDEVTKVVNYFYDTDAKKTLHGFPEPEGNTEDYSTEDWKIHFLRVQKFLLSYFADTIVPKLQNRTPNLDAARASREGYEYPENEYSEDEIPL